jgi:hypothetical protein
MNATLLYRIASGLLVVFAASHTSGLLTLEESSPEVQGVRGLGRVVGHGSKGRGLIQSDFARQWSSKVSN